MPKTYGQFCGLARALDHVGDRWTLLIIRELLIASAAYGALVAALGGIPTNLLANRLRVLETDGLVARRRDPADGRRVIYELTDLGAQLEAPIMALIAWGGHWMRAGQGGDRFEPRWGMLAMRALLSGRRVVARGTVVVHIDGYATSVTAVPGRPLQVDAAAPSAPNATVSGSGETLLGLASGEISMAEARGRGLTVRGDAALAGRILTP
jgi:DNA-binding HxlR family transcriptional regulator